MKAYVFPGQGSQFIGMGKELYESSAGAKAYFDKADKILGFNITEIMFSGTDEDLKKTSVTQPAIFLHSVVRALTLPDFAPEMVAGHSLGEFSALVANQALTFEDGLKLVFKRAQAMQKACELTPSTMAAILGMDDEAVAKICASIDEVVVPANYNCPGQIVISGSIKGIDVACEKLTEAGARRALKLNVGGAFHSPLMEPAKVELEEAIHAATVSKPICPIYQNVTGQVVSNPDIIKSNLIAQLTAPVKWTQTMNQMLRDGATSFTEVGPGRVLSGLLKKVNRQIETSSEG
ncbi:MAG: [acyl-carrier-protein] S-malonyltransferase [Bacteroidia bacterium]|jgi:[acyl-carrier-protein] S-malonyltransferase